MGVGILHRQGPDGFCLPLFGAAGGFVSRERRLETGHDQGTVNYHGCACILIYHSHMFEAWAAWPFQSSLRSPMEL